MKIRCYCMSISVKRKFRLLLLWPPWHPSYFSTLVEWSWTLHSRGPGRWTVRVSGRWKVVCNSWKCLVWIRLYRKRWPCQNRKSQSNWMQQSAKLSRCCRTIVVPCSIQKVLEHYAIKVGFLMSLYKKNAN